MKKIASLLKDRAFTEHLDEMQLALFRENRLDEEEREEVFKHLSQCKRCRDVLKVASEIREEQQKLKTANNIDYKPTLKKLGVVASFAIIFFTTPKLDHQFDAPVFKGFVEEKSLIDETIEYWEKLFEKILNFLQN